MPDLIEEAHAELVRQASRLGAAELSKLERVADGRAAFTLKLNVDDDRISLRVVVPFAFPFGEIETFIDDVAWHRFAHQDVSGKICPPPGAISARDSSRLVQAIEVAREWIHDAPRGALSPPGDRYELPQFPVQRADWLLLFDEEAADCARWLARRGTSGGLSFVAQGRGWLIDEFRAADGSVIARRTSLRAPTDAARVQGRWIVVNAFAPSGHRVARAWSELQDLFGDLEVVVRQAWVEAPGDVALVVIGVPIPSTWDGVATRMHWRPIVMESYRAARKKAKGAGVSRKKLFPTKLWNRSFFKDPIPWGLAEDVSRARLYVRADTPLPQFTSPLLIGCGALGSALADNMVRAGLPRIGLMDGDVLEYGNLCRHVLTAAALRVNKARALAAHLESVSPSVHARYWDANLPPQTNANESRFNEALKNTDLVIDATGNNEVLGWLGSNEGERPIASIWTNADASVGAAVLAGPGCGVTADQLAENVRAAISAGSVPGVSIADYRGPELLVPGTGCWHPTFRGSWARMVALSGAMTEWLYRAVRVSRNGRLVVFRFSEGTWKRARAWSI